MMVPFDCSLVRKARKRCAEQQTTTACKKLYCAVATIHATFLSASIFACFLPHIFARMIVTCARDRKKVIEFVRVAKDRSVPNFKTYR